MYTIIPKSIVKVGNCEDSWPGNYYPNGLEKVHEKQMAILIKDQKQYNLIADMLDFLYVNLINATQMTEQYKNVSWLIDGELKDKGIEVKLEDFIKPIKDSNKNTQFQNKFKIFRSNQLFKNGP
jgi:hypothetical protein